MRPLRIGEEKRKKKRRKHRSKTYWPAHHYVYGPP